MQRISQAEQGRRDMKPQLTKRGTPRQRAAGAGPKPKPDGERIRSKQIRVHLRTFDRLTELSKSGNEPITEIVGRAVDKL